jgi:hypothetical protein
MWWEGNAQRALANNSVAYTEKPDMETFMREWLSLVESKSGERGIFSRQASKKQSAKNGRRAKTILVTLEDGSKKEFDANEFVNGIPAYLLQEGDEV